MQSIKQIKLLEKDIIKDNKNINNLIDLLTFLENDDPKVILKCLRSLQRTFKYLITQNSLIYLNSIPFQNHYISWLQDRYNDTVQLLLDKFSHEIFAISNVSLDILMDFNKTEILNTKKKSLNNAFINKILENILQNSISDEKENLILKFSEYLKFDDIRFSVMKCLQKLMINDDVSLNNQLLFLLLKNLHSPKRFKTNVIAVNDSLVLRNYFALSTDKKDITNNNFEKDQQKLFGDIWIAFIKKNHDTELYKLIIGCIGDKVIPFMSCPLSLADILTNAYNAGGSISLLALNAIFLLINDYNLQYPDFYGKLYKIVQPKKKKVPTATLR